MSPMSGSTTHNIHKKLYTVLRILEDEIEITLWPNRNETITNSKIYSISPSKLKEQRQIILNLYNSGIEPDVIAYQLDISQEEANKIIKEDEEKKKELEMKQKILDASPSMGSSFYLDAVVNIDLAIRNAQTRMWKALRSGPEFNISIEGTNKILNQFSKSKVIFVILHIDLVGSTQLSMTLSLKAYNYNSNI